MNNNNNQEPRPPMYPSVPPPLTQHEANPFLQSYPTHAPEDVNPFSQTPEAPKHQTSSVTADHLEKWQPAPPPTTPPPSHHDIPSSSSSSEQVPAAATSPTFDNEDLKAKAAAEAEPEKWGTHVMGHPAVPTCHPDNKKAALWGVGADGTEKAQSFHYPYLQYQPIDHNNKASSSNPTQSMLNIFNSWSHKAESMANNIWHNLKTGTSVSGAAWAKVNLQAKALTGGGFEAIYKQTFATYPNEKLHKSFACYLSTSTGPVAGTLYLSNIHSAFCSDRPLSFTAPSGQVTWSYYKVMVPLANVATINPVVMTENPTEKYLQIVTIDGHDFWFMGFVNYEKASKHLAQSISTFVASGFAAQSPSYEKPSGAEHKHEHEHKKGGD